MTHWKTKCRCGKLRRTEHDATYDRHYCGRCFEWTENRCECDPAGEPLRDMNGNIVPGSWYVCPYIGIEHPLNAKHNQQ